MDTKQIKFGEQKLKEIAKEWGVSEEKAARILMSEEFKFRHFFSLGTR